MPAVFKVVVALAAALWLTAGTAWAQQPIRPGEPFGGVVNGNTVQAQVFVVCPGPVFGGRTGPPAGNQSLMVVFGKLGGSTGSASSVVAAFKEDPSVRVVFTEYGVPQPVPSTLKLPCGGSGSVTFTPFAPTGSDPGVADVVPVEYVNIAA
jgi:hypothetical protein